MMRRIVLAIDDEGSTVAIGPVGTDRSVEKIRAEIERKGWDNYGVVAFMAVYEFRAARAATSTPDGA